MSCTLIHGDCLVEMDKLIEDGVRVDMILTDPPYGTTKCKWDSIIPFEPMWENIKQLRNDNTCICLFGNEPFSSHLRLSNIKEYRYDWIWHKTKCSNFLNAKKQPFFKTENISVFYKRLPNYNPQMEKGKPYTIKEHYYNTSQQEYGTNNYRVSCVNKGERYPSTLIKFSNNSNKNHPTEKPVHLLEYLIKTYTNEDSLVLDFTMGSGSTGVACLQTNRNFIGIELDEKYYNIAKKRCSEYQSKLW